MSTAERGPGKPRALTPEKEAMVASLRREGFGVARIAEVFGISVRTAHAIFLREGVATSKARHVLTLSKEAELLDLARAGWSQRELAAHFAISVDAVRTVKRRAQTSHAAQRGVSTSKLSETVSTEG